MRRVLVPLDGTDLGISILPDARRLAGPDGELVLIHVISSAVYDHSSAIYRQSLFYREPTAVEAAQHYLDLQAEMLHSEGVRVQRRLYRWLSHQLSILQPESSRST